MKNLIYLLFLLLTSTVVAQELNLNGIGLITPEILIIEGCELDNCDLEIDLYLEPGQKSGICLNRIKDGMDHIVTQIVDPSGDDEIVRFDNSSLIWTGYKSFSLQYFKRRKGYVQIHLAEKHYWVKEEDLDLSDFEIISWVDYYKNTTSDNITVNYNLNLRTGPSVINEKLLLLKINRYNDEFYHHLKMTGNFDGNWAEVEVKIWKSMGDYCGEFRNNPIKKIIGWIKYLDDSGFPNIYNIPTPCC